MTLNLSIALLLMAKVDKLTQKKAQQMGNLTNFEEGIIQGFCESVSVIHVHFTPEEANEYKTIMDEKLGIKPQNKTE